MSDAPKTLSETWMRLFGARSVKLKNSLDDLHKCAQRELSKRKTVYPRWITEGRIGATFADHQVEMMTEICQVLAWLTLNKPVEIEDGDQKRLL